MTHYNAEQYAAERKAREARSEAQEALLPPEEPIIHSPETLVMLRAWVTHMENNLGLEVVDPTASPDVVQRQAEVTEP